MNYISMIKLQVALSLFLFSCSYSLFGMQSSSHVIEEYKTHTKEDELSSFAQQRQLQLFGLLYKLEAMESLPKELINLICEYVFCMSQASWVKPMKNACGTVYQAPKMIKCVQAHQNAICCLVALSDGGFATAAQNDPVVKLWNARGENPIKCMSKMKCINTLVQLDDELVVAGGFTLDKHNQAQKMVQWTRISPLLKEFDETLGFKDSEKAGEVLCMVPFGGTRKTALVFGSSDGSIVYCVPASRSKVSSEKKGTGIIALACLGNRSIVSISKNNKIYLWSLSNNIKVPVKTGPNVKSLNFNSDIFYAEMKREKVSAIEPFDSSSFIIGCNSGYMTRWDIREDCDQRLGWRFGDKISYIKTLPNGDRLLVLQDGVLVLYDPKANTCKAVSEDPLGMLAGFTMLPSNQLVSGDIKGNVRIWS